MSSHDVKSIDQGAIIVANDLRTGRTVYYSGQHQWSDERQQATVFVDIDVANEAIELSQSEVNSVLDPYLVATNATGVPSHIREAIRTSGPTIQARNRNALNINTNQAVN